jgi:hypothetical protein
MFFQSAITFYGTVISYGNYKSEVFNYIMKACVIVVSLSVFRVL